MAGPGFAAESVVVADAELSPDASTADSRRASARQLALIARLEPEPGVMGVAFSSGSPGFAGSDRIRFEEGAHCASTTPRWSRQPRLCFNRSAAFQERHDCRPAYPVGRARAQEESTCRFVPMES